MFPCIAQRLGSVSGAILVLFVCTPRALGGAAHATVAACVDAHVAAVGGDPLRVRRLDCALPPPEECPGEEPDLAPLARVPNLVVLDLSGRCIRSVSRIAALGKLRRLELAHNQIELIRELGKLRELRYLGLASNPVRSAWIFSNREPFSELARLEELVLDDTHVDNILPLAQARALRVLSLRRTWTLSLRPLVALPQLRELHVDGSPVTDLSPLAGMTQLEALSAESSFIRSVAPLVPLVRRGGLRRVALRENCTAACDALEGAAYDCSEVRPAEHCEVELERDVEPWYNGVPVHLVERFAPADLQLWTGEQLARAFELARSAPEIDWKDARGNCDGRAAATEALLREHGFPASTRVSSLGNLRMLSEHDPLGYLMFDWHVAVAVRVRFGGGASGVFVIDPALDESGPLHVRDWFARQVDSAGSSLDFSCERYWENPNLCRDSLLVDERGDFRVDPLSLVRGAICAEGNVCLP